jgi:hypothetical protein
MAYHPSAGGRPNGGTNARMVTIPLMDGKNSSSESGMTNCELIGPCNILTRFNAWIPACYGAIGLWTPLSRLLEGQMQRSDKYGRVIDPLTSGEVGLFYQSDVGVSAGHWMRQAWSLILFLIAVRSLWQIVIFLGGGGRAEPSWLCSKVDATIASAIYFGRIIGFLFCLGT